MKYQRILLAYNGSEDGKRALFEGAELAELHHAEIHLLAVASTPPSLFLTDGFVSEGLLEQEKTRMQLVLREAIQGLTDKGLEATGHFAVGEPVEEIGRLANDLAVDLIVLGHNQSRSFANRWWKGSVGATMLDFSPCSLLFVRSSRN